MTCDLRIEPEKELGVIYESKWDWTNLAMLKIFSALKKLPRKFPRDTQIFLPNSDTIHPSTLSFHRSPLEVAQSSSSLLFIIDSTIYSIIIEIIIYGIFISVIITANFLRCAQRGLLPRLCSRSDQSTGSQTTVFLPNVPFLFFCLFYSMTISSGTQATMAGYPLPAQRNCVSYCKEFITIKRLNITEICCSKGSS